MAASANPTSNVRSPKAGWSVGTTPTYLVWLENSQIDNPPETSIAIGPAQFV